MNLKLFRKVANKLYWQNFIAEMFTNTACIGHKVNYSIYSSDFEIFYCL